MTGKWGVWMLTDTCSHTYERYAPGSPQLAKILTTSPPRRDACTGASTKSTYAAPQQWVLTRRSFLKRQRVLQNKVLEKASEESE